MTLTLHTIICSTRPGRVGPVVADWFHQQALDHGRFKAELVDLASFALPIYDEPKHPSLRDYAHDHTKAWSASVAAADAYVFVTPEYNYGPPPSLLNAFNYVYHEWSYKPAAFVSYGGVSGGLRAVQSEKLTLTTLKVMPLVEQVVIPFVGQQIEGGAFRPNELQSQSATRVLTELHRWAEALKPMRG